VQRRHPPGHQGCAVRHADRRGDVEALEARARGGQTIDAGRSHPRIAVTTEMVGAVLVGDDQEEVGFSIHNLNRLAERIVYHSGVLMQCVLAFNRAGSIPASRWVQIVVPSRSFPHALSGNPGGVALDPR